MGGDASKERDMSWTKDLERRLEVLQLQKQAEINKLCEATNLKMRQLELEAQNKNTQGSHEHQQKLEAIKREIRQLELDHEQKLKEHDIEMQKLTNEFKLKLEELGLKGQELQNAYDLEMARIQTQREEGKLRGELMHKLIDQNLSTTDFLVKALCTGAAVDAESLGKAVEMLQLLHNPAILPGERNETRAIENASQSEI